MRASVAEDGELGARLSRLTEWLQAHGALWRERPFVVQPVPWAAQHPDLSAWLLTLSPEAVTRLEAGESVPGQPEALRALLEMQRALVPVSSEILAPSEVTSATDPVRLRKRTQIRALTALALPLIRSQGLLHVIDWCSGKGHLGRRIAAASECSLTLVERDAELCADGVALADASGLQCTAIQEDVLLGDVAPALPRGGLLVGLHACGALGERLLQAAVVTEQPGVMYAPCCYHRGYTEAPYRPMSEAARAAGLALQRSDLRLPTLDESIVSPHKRARRLREQAWRLAVDLLIREASGRDVYTALGPAPKRWLAGSFEEFARRITSRADLALPVIWSVEAALQAGTVRAEAARALGAVRSVFRRPLELWLVLDRALYLQESGYDVRLRSFCDPAVSPRNLVLLADRRRSTCCVIQKP